MELTLSKEEVIELTGYRRRSKQIDWLKRNGLRFFVGADGHPRVPRSSINAEQKQRVNRPDFSSLSPRG